MIVRWGLEALSPVLDELRLTRPFLVASRRWSSGDLPIDAAGWWQDVPSAAIERAAAVVGGADADAMLALGGGSAIDLAKAVSAATGLPLVSVPTTYAGAEWTTYFGVRDRDRRMQGGGSGAHPVAVVYEPRLTLDLPAATTGGTALNALAHCAEALYVRGHNEAADREALRGARLIATWLPVVLADGRNLDARTRLLEGAAHAGAALAGSGLALGHALAQAVGGRYGIPHGTLNAVCLPPALRFNSELAPGALERLGMALEADDPAAAVERLAALAGGPLRLRDLGVPGEDLPDLAAAAAARSGNQANPRPATPREAEALLRSVW